MSNLGLVDSQFLAVLMTTMACAKIPLLEARDRKKPQPILLFESETFIKICEVVGIGNWQDIYDLTPN